MENKITSGSFAAKIALATGAKKELCEDYLKELFTIIEDALATGDTVRIKGIGTFKTVSVEQRKSVDVATGLPNEIPAHRKVVYVPSKELAGIVNSAFSAFEATEVSDGIPTDELMESVREEDERQEIATLLEPEIQQTEQEFVCEEPDASQKEPESTQELHNDIEIENEESTFEVDNESRPHKFGWGFAAGFITALLLACGAVAVVLYTRLPGEAGDGLAEVCISKGVLPEPADSVAVAVGRNAEVSSGTDIGATGNSEVATLPSDRQVTDTITKTRYLTTMAKDHYGNFNFWPIIYEENKSILGHPDRIKPGTAVVIPSLKKYGVSPNNAEDVKTMKERGKEIYRKFK